ncbi:MAG: DUF3783 domain-containing protein [Thermoplasmatales archaeon]
MAFWMTKVMILHEFKRDEYLKLLKCMKEAGVYEDTIVAMTTDSSINWKVGDLINELILEDENLKNKNNG